MKKTKRKTAVISSNQIVKYYDFLTRLKERIEQNKEVKPTKWREHFKLSLHTFRTLTSNGWIKQTSKGFYNWTHTGKITIEEARKFCYLLREYNTKTPVQKATFELEPSAPLFEEATEVKTEQKAPEPTNIDFEEQIRLLQKDIIKLQREKLEALNSKKSKPSFFSRLFNKKNK